MPVPVIAPVMGGAGMIAGAAANPVMDTMGRVNEYFTGAPMTMEEAQKRGLAGVAGGTIDNITGGMTDFDKRGDSKKQKDTKDFLRKFIFGTQGVAGRDMEGQLGAAPGSLNYEMPGN